MGIDYNSEDFIDYFNNNIIISSSNGNSYNVTKIEYYSRDAMKISCAEGTGTMMPRHKFDILVRGYKKHQRDKVIENVLKN